MNELTNDIHAAIDEGIKPEKRAPDFNRYAVGDKNKDLNEVMEIEETKTKAKRENKAKAKESYAVGNNFKSTEA